jgi:hypothetical protein
MHKDFTLIPDDQPGVLARLGEAAGTAGINIEGISAFTGEGKGVVHLLVRDPEGAQQALADAGFDVRAARDVLVLDIEDRPGAMGEVCRRLADENINIAQAYIAGGTHAGDPGYRLVLAVDDIERARQVL